jgi:hypothetical protein
VSLYYRRQDNLSLIKEIKKQREDNKADKVRYTQKSTASPLGIPASCLSRVRELYPLHNHMRKTRPFGSADSPRPGADSPPLSPSFFIAAHAAGADGCASA